MENKTFEDSYLGFRMLLYVLFYYFLTFYLTVIVSVVVPLKGKINKICTIKKEYNGNDQNCNYNNM